MNIGIEGAFVYRGKRVVVVTPRTIGFQRVSATNRSLKRLFRRRHHYLAALVSLLRLLSGLFILHGSKNDGYVVSAQNRRRTTT